MGGGEEWRWCKGRDGNGRKRGEERKVVCKFKAVLYSSKFKLDRYILYIGLPLRDEN